MSDPEPDEGAPPADPALTARTEFLGSLAHDMRSPLGVVSQALAELRSDFGSQLTDEHRLLISLADRGLARLGRIAEMVTLAASLDAGTLELHRQPVDLCALVRSAADGGASIETRRGVELACEIPADPCPTHADANRLIRAVTEVVINGLRHARSRTRVRLERLGEHGAQITIEDDGHGVPADRRASLFRRFVPRPTRSGLGLGLSIAHDILAAHGGNIALEASTLPPGRPGTVGARFVLWLPLHAAP